MPIETDFISVWDTPPDGGDANGKVFRLDLDVGDLKAPPETKPTQLPSNEPHWTAVFGTGDDRDSFLVLTVLSEDRVFALNGVEFGPEELTFLKSFDWSWDLDTFSELADLPDHVIPFGELLSRSKEAFGEEAGQDFFDRLMGIEVSYQAFDDEIKTHGFGEALFRFSGVSGAFFADPERADAMVAAFTDAIETR
ncbi:MAG: hypothetical protein QNJ44_22800 [Rhodobacter sp.]|nr:hypothetical protein [Rhodobacter sp.]